MSPYRETSNNQQLAVAWRDPCIRGVTVATTALALSIGLACATSPVERPGNQTRSGTTAADQGYWEEAEFRWQKALAFTSVNARALNNLAVRFEREGEFEAAKEYYDRALSLVEPDERPYVLRNHGQFLPIWQRIDTGEVTDDEGSFAEESPVHGPTEIATPGDLGAPTSLGLLEITISVPDQGPNLAGYNRILVGNFAPREDSEANLNDMAVRYLRRRITQRTFFETQDQLEQALDPARRI